MPSIKIFALGGLDQKSNDLTRAIDKASEMQNMEYDTQSTIKKRTGYELYSASSNSEMIYCNYTDEKLLFTNGSSDVVLYKDDSTTKTLSLPLKDSTNYFTITSADISHTENQNNLYFTSADLSIPVMKYDGSNIYRAGLPAPRKESEALPTWSTTIAGYTRIFYSFKDINGNETFSPYRQIQYQPQNLSSVLSVNSFKPSTTISEQGFLYRYCWYNITLATSLNSSNRTLVTEKNNYVAGDIFLFEQDVMGIINRIVLPLNKTYVKWVVESSTSTSITFTEDSVGDDTIIIPAAGSFVSYPIDIRTKIRIYVSQNSDYGYVPYGIANGEFIIDGNVLTNTQDMNVLYEVKPYSYTGSSKLAFEDIYDSTTFKLMPAYCKYIASYGNQIIYGNIGKVFNADNSPSNYDNDDLIIYSDLSTGDGPEGSSPINFEKIGETWDGSITGLRRCNDSLVIFKNHGVFSIDGALLPSQYQLRKMTTNYSGCTSHKSILETDDGLFFQSHNGIYYTNAISVKKISYELDSYFGSSNYNLTRSVRFKTKQKALFYIDGTGLTNQKIVVVDYYYQQVYFWTGITPSTGFIEDKNGNVFFSDGSSIYKFRLDIYNDNMLPIDAYYSTTYHHCGDPSLRKKFLAIRLFSLTSNAFDLSVTHDSDWKMDNTQNSHAISFTSTDKTKRIVHDMQTVRAQRYTFRNNIVDQPMVISGYEITWEPYEQHDKN